MQAKHIIVHGRVQGVGFRYFTRDAAEGLGLSGDVRNCPDGTVEIIAEGSAEALADFLKEVERGPARGRVDRTQVEDVPAQGDYKSFSVEGR